MPHNIPPQSRVPKQTNAPRDVLPQQKPVTDEISTIPRSSKLKKFFKRVGIVILIALALVLIYIFLLLGEPENTAVDAPPVREEVIHVPMAALEMPDGGDLGVLAASFGQPLLALYGDFALQKSNLSDTAFQGSYARKATLTYQLEDGHIITVESIRPTTAVSLLQNGNNSTLRVETLYTLAGLDATRMDTSNTITIFGKSPDAVYAIHIPTTNANQLSALLKQTTLVHPQVVE